MEDRCDHVIECDPAHVLPSAADDASYSHPKGCQHFRERSSRTAQDEPGPKIDDPDVLLRCDVCSSLPLSADVSQKARTRRALFGENLVAAIAIISDGRGADQNARPLGQRSQCLAQEPRPSHAAFSDARFLVRRPTRSRNVLACKMHDRVEPFEQARIEAIEIGVPRNFVGHGR